MGVATMYAETLDPKYMGLFNPISEGFLMIRIPNVCGKSNSYVSNSNFGIICSKTPLRGLAPINEVEEVLIHLRFNIVHGYLVCAKHDK